VVLTGIDRDFVGAMIFPDIAACHTLSPELPAGATQQILASAAVRARFQSLLNALAAQSTGSSNRVERAILLEESPSLDAGEITDKGSFNQRAVLDRRAALVDKIYAREPQAGVIEARKD
jgi:feruloyl-CoA synthase